MDRCKEKVKEKFSLCLDFSDLRRFAKPYKSEAQRRIKENLEHFYQCYVIIDLIIILSVMTDWLDAANGISPLLFLYFSRELIFSSHPSYKSFIIPLVFLILSLLQWYQNLIKPLIISSAFTLVHSLYHDFPSSISPKI